MKWHTTIRTEKHDCIKNYDYHYDDTQNKKVK